MLLSSHNTYNNSRVMDDFADQDWFAEHDDVVNNSGKQLADQQQQQSASPFHVPVDLQFLDLDVPLDEESVFYGRAQQQQQQPLQGQYLEQIPGQSSSSIPFQAQNTMEGGLLERRRHLAEPYMASTDLIAAAPVGGDFAEHDKCLYNLDYQPNSSSLAMLRPCSPHQQRLAVQPVGQQERPWMDQHVQQHYQPMDQHQQQQHGHLNGGNPFPSNADKSFYAQNGGGCGPPFPSPHSPMVNSNSHNNSMVQLDLPHSSAHFSPANCLNVPPSQRLFYGEQQQFVVASSTSSADFIAPPPEHILTQHQVIEGQPNHSSHLLPPPSLPANNAAKTVVPKKSRPKKKSNASQQQQQNNNAKQGEAAADEDSSGLDQIAKSLLSNNQTATLQFGDPFQAMEFASLMGRCQQLMEQKSNGMDVNSELKQVEASIAECIMRNSTSSTSSSTSRSAEQQQQQLPCTSSELIPQQQQVQQVQQPKKSKSKRKPPPKQPPPSLPPTTTTFVALAAESPCFTLPPPTQMLRQTNVPMVVQQQAAISMVLPNGESKEQFQKQQHFPLIPFGGAYQNMATTTSSSVGHHQQRQQPFSAHPASSAAVFVTSQSALPGTSSSSSLPFPSQNPPPAPPLQAVFVSLNAAQQQPHPIQQLPPAQHFIVHQQLEEKGKGGGGALLNTRPQPKGRTISLLVPADIPSADLANNSAKPSTSVPVIYSRRQIRVVAQESAEEVAQRVAQQRERRRQRLSEHFEKMRQQIASQDYTKPFSSELDCIQKLLPFGLFLEPELNDQFLANFDAELDRHSALMRERREGVEHRLRSILFRQAMAEDGDETGSLLLFLDAQFEAEQLRREIGEKDPKLAERHPSIAIGAELDWEYGGKWDEARFRNIPPFTPSPEPREEAVEESSESEDEEEEEGKMEVEECQEQEKEEEPLPEIIQESVGRFASVQVHLQAYQAVELLNSNDDVKGQEVTRESEEKTALSMDMLKETLALEEAAHQRAIMPNTEAASMPTVQQFSLEAEAQKLVVIPSMVPLKVEESPKVEERPPMIVPILEKHIVVGRQLDEEEEERAGNEASRMDRNAEDQKLIEIVPPMELEKQNSSSEPGPVKLKIKLGQKKIKKEQKSDKTDDDVEGKRERKRLKKELKRKRKAEKKAARKLTKKQRAKDEEKGAESGRGGGEDVPGTSGQAEQQESQESAGLIRSQPLKISLKRPTPILPPPSCKQEEKKLSARRKEAAGRDEEESSTSKSAGCFDGLLKLRISKMVLGGGGGNGKNEEEKHPEKPLQNGGKKDEEEEAMEERKMRKERRRKLKKKKRKEEGEGAEEPPKKVPKIKIRFGSSAMATNWTREREEEKEGQQKQVPDGHVHQQQLLEPVDPLPSTSQSQQCATSHLPGIFSPRDELGEEVPGKHFQFSPCSSDDESDTELRKRTNQLLSKIGRLL